MYLDFYGLAEAPFNLTPDPRYLYFSRQHREAFQAVLLGIMKRKGLIQLTGEVGAGKSTIWRAVLEHLHGGYHTALILNPVMTPTQLLRAILGELGLPNRKNDRMRLSTCLNEFLLEKTSADEDVVLIIDEAQDMSDQLLDEVRLLAKLETHGRKLLQIVLVGQSELRDRLARRRMRPLAQRIAVQAHLDPLDQDDTAAYLRYRLRVAGAKERPTFSPRAVRAIHRRSGGIPRLINALADMTLLAGYVEREDHLRARHVRRAVRELEGRL